KRIPVVTADHTADLIKDLGFGSVTELRWGERHRLGELTITACEANHWGARTYYDHFRGFNSYLIESATHRVLDGGDSAYHDQFRGRGKVDLAILGIGGYGP